MQKFNNYRVINLFSFFYIAIYLFAFLLPWYVVVVYNGVYILNSISMYLVFFSWLFVVLSLRGQWKFPLPVFLSFLLFIIVSAISLIANSSAYFDGSIQSFWNLLTRFAITFVLVGAFVIYPSARHKAIMVYSLGALLAFALLFLGFNSPLAGLRYYLVNGNPNGLAFIFCIALAFAFYLIKQPKNKLMVFFSIVLMLVSITGIVLTASRSAMLAASFVIFVEMSAYIFAQKNTKFRWFKFLLLIIIFYGIIYYLFFAFTKQTAILLRWDSDLDGRMLVWNQGIQFFYDRMLLGYGPGSFSNLFKSSASLIGISAPENMLIMELVEGGMIGLLALLLFFATIFFNILKNRKGDFFIFKMVLFIVIMINLFSQSGYYDALVWFVFAIILS